MPLDPQVARLLEQMAGQPRAHQQTVAEARAGMMARARPQPPEVGSIRNASASGPAGAIPVRIYRPRTAPVGLLVYFHGGGWVAGNLDSHDGLARFLVDAAGCVLVSVDYRLAPEHRFPAAAEDAYAATKWAASEISADNLAVGGDSAGGNLAAVSCLIARDRGGPAITQQLLMYPITSCAFTTPSYASNASGYDLDLEDMRWYWQHYLGDSGDGSNPYASPLQAPDLSGLPPAIIMTAEYDPLCSEGDDYAARLGAAGVPVRHHRYRGMIHSFLTMGPPLDGAKAAFRDIGAALKQGFAAGPRDQPTQDCPNCGHTMPGIKGATSSLCPNCGYKESCCY